LTCARSSATACVPSTCTPLHKPRKRGSAGVSVRVLEPARLPQVSDAHPPSPGRALLFDYELSGDRAAPYRAVTVGLAGYLNTRGMIAMCSHCRCCRRVLLLNDGLCTSIFRARGDEYSHGLCPVCLQYSTRGTKSEDEGPANVDEFVEKALYASSLARDDNQNCLDKFTCRWEYAGGRPRYAHPSLSSVARCVLISQWRGPWGLRGTITSILKTT